MKRQLMRTLSAKMDIPSEILTQDPLIEIRGDGHVAVDHHSAILEYTRQTIQLSTRTGLVCVEGSGLTITLLTRTRVEIRGKISAVRLG